MKTRNFAFTKLSVAILGALVLSLSAISCTKDDVVNPGDPGTGIHKVDPKLVGKWMWTNGSDAAYYDNNGVYKGSAYGFALQFTINADGTGTCFDHIFSTLGGGTGLEVNISYNGYYESDSQGNMDFYSTGGTYKSTSGTNRALRSDEVWNPQTGKGAHFDLHHLVLTTQGQRVCFQVTDSDGSVSTFYKMP